ncbi:MAG TPA: hypothetical protein VLK84_31545 [Longimicrobium sp.]|nr:hypothetical protein [Longimicrobium sp.]
MGTIQAVRRVVFGTATAAALAFGGTQALAAPAPAAQAQAVCTPELCNQFCAVLTGFTGACNARGICVCFR